MFSFRAWNSEYCAIGRLQQQLHGSTKELLDLVETERVYPNMMAVFKDQNHPKIDLVTGSHRKWLLHVLLRAEQVCYEYKSSEEKDGEKIIEL